MELHPGSRLGTYEVTDLIGEGGMGSVYRARDTRLGREVALKIVRSPLSDSPERIQRFTREAQLLASLNHPNIATIHGLEEAHGVRFIVLEVVPGHTLAERIEGGPLPVREALTLAAQIAAAIESAHERGVIHRDLKPANIKITPDGHVKVLDFGLAKAFAPDSFPAEMGSRPTIVSGETADGTILGTAPYMSPEQARGREVDKRTDIWAFGCVLFEMLAGETSFGRDSVSDTIAAILTREVEWSRLPGDLPPSIRRLLRRLLTKDLQRRQRDMADARLEIEEALAGGADEAASAAAEKATGGSARRWWGLAAAAVVGALALAAYLVQKPSSPATPAAQRQIQFSLPLPDDHRLGGLSFPVVAFSPLETHVVFAAARGGREQLFIRALSARDPLPIAGTEGALSPFFSPDGQWIGFFADGKLKKVRIDGGPARTVCDAAIGFGGVWLPDGTIVFSPDNGSALWRVPADGGEPSPVTTLDASRGEFSHRWPELLPGADAVLFTVGTEGSWDDAEIVVQSLQSGERRTVVHGGTNPKIARRDRLLYARDGAVFAAPFDARRQQVTAAASQVLPNVAQSSDGAMQLSLSGTGSVVYLPGQAAVTAQRLVWVDRQGNAQPLAAPERDYSSPRLAPDGRSLAVTVTGADRDEIWRFDVAHNSLTQVTFGGGTSPVWASGGRLLFAASREGPANLFWTRSHGGGTEERLTRSPFVETPSSFSADGRSAAYVRKDPATGYDILLLNTGDRAPRPFAVSPANESGPAFSPDGRWLAYVSDESGRREVFVAPLGEPQRKRIVSSGGGSEPAWRLDGSELYFRSGTRMMAAAVKAGSSFTVESVDVLFEGAFEAGVAASRGYDISADGARFLMVADATGDLAPTGFRIILGWNGSGNP